MRLTIKAQLLLELHPRDRSGGGCDNQACNLEYNPSPSPTTTTTTTATPASTPLHPSIDFVAAARSHRTTTSFPRWRPTVTATRITRWTPSRLVSRLQCSLVLRVSWPPVSRMPSASKTSAPSPSSPRLVDSSSHGVSHPLSLRGFRRVNQDRAVGLANTRQFHSCRWWCFRVHKECLCKLAPEARPLQQRYWWFLCRCRARLAR